MMEYQAYAEDCLPWCSRFPSHWNFMRAKFMYRKESRPVRPDDRVVTCFRDGEVTLRENRRTTGFTEAIQENGYQGIRKGDLVIHVMDAFAGAIGVSDSDGKGTPVYSVCTALGDYNNYYYAYVLRVMAKSGYIQSLYKGVRERSSDFRFEVFAKQHLPVPPREEQEQIVEFLNWKIRIINHLIENKKKKIKALHDFVEAKIEMLVFGEGYPGRKVRTGIPWARTAPDSWKRYKYGACLSVKQASVEDGGANETLLSLTTDGVIKRDIESGKGKFPSDFSTYQLVKTGEFVFCLFDLDETPRTVGLSRLDGMITGAYTIMHLTTKEILPEFLLFYFICIDNKKGYKPIYSGLRKTIKSNIFLHQFFYAPSVNEQKSIVTKIKNMIQLEQRFKVNLTKEIDCLQELKSKMISDVVTGKLDVRNIKIPTHAKEA